MASPLPERVADRRRDDVQTEKGSEENSKSMAN